VAAVSPIARPTRVTPPDTALAELYERHADRVFGFCLKWLRSREEAEDAVQTTFFYAWRGLGRGVVPELESAWLLAIARNVCRSRTRAARRRAGEIAEDPSVLEAAVEAPVRGDELSGLPEALASLTEQQRRAILLREWQGLSYREIADELGLSQSAVETLLFRARRTLAARLRRPVGAGSLLPWLKSALGGGAAKVGVGAIVVAATVATGAVVATQHAKHATPPGQPAAGGSERATTAAGPAAATRRPPLPLSRVGHAADVKRGRYLGPATPTHAGAVPEQPAAPVAPDSPAAPRAADAPAPPTPTTPETPSSIVQQTTTSAETPLQAAADAAVATVGSTVDTAGATVDTATSTAAAATDTVVATVDSVGDTVTAQLPAPPALPTVTVPTKLP
jgi:RNA polymerase sigma-70 factor, ECF subfamily